MAVLGEGRQRAAGAVSMASVDARVVERGDLAGGRHEHVGHRLAIAVPALGEDVAIVRGG